LQQRLAWRLGLLFLVIFIAGSLMLFFRYRSDEDELAADRLLQFIRDVTAGLVADPGGHWRVALPPDHEPFEFVVRDANGAVLASSSPNAVERMARPSDGPDGGDRGSSAAPPRPTLTGAFARVETAAGPITVEVAEAESLNSEEVRRAGQESLEDVVPILVPFILAALVIGVYTIRKSLAPLAAVARQAAAITPSETHHRLTQEGLPRELEPLVAAVNGALDRLDEGFRRQREFTADAAHELRTPLAILAAHLENLGEGGAAATLREDVARMGRLVGQLLSVAQLEALAVAPDEVADLQALARDVAESMAPFAVQQGKEIAVVGADAPIRVHGNGESLRQAIRNLAENAVQHTPEGTSVEIEVTSEPAVRVCDHGPGVPAGLRERVTRRFWRADRSSGDGSGLGLAIVKRIADAHGGQFEIDDAPGGGARFTLRLPRGHPAAAVGGIGEL
jgi:signal transduction histidine kinase